MNIYILGLYSLLSTIFTFIGFKFLSPFTFKSFNEVEVVLQSALDSFTKGNQESYMLIAALILTTLGLFMAIFTISQLFNPELEYFVSDKLPVGIIASLLVVDSLISFYLLLFAIIILIFVALLLIFLFIFLNSITFNNGGGSVNVRGHYRKGSYVSSHTRRRPRR